MIKKIAIGLLLLIGVFAVWFWAIFIKYQPNNKMLDIVLINGQLEIQTEQSAKYISVDTTISHDTLAIKVYTTSVMNPFAEKSWHKIIRLDQSIKYVNFDDKISPLSKYEKRHYY